MPQLNPEFWVSQIFWLTLIFGSLYILLSKFILPKISNNLETRKSQIVETLRLQKNKEKRVIKKLKITKKLFTMQKLKLKIYLTKHEKKF